MGSKPMSFKVTTTDEEVLGWVRKITIKDEDGNEFRCRLSWQEGNGYELDWYDGEPDWASEWNEDDHDGLFLEWWLDEESSK